MSEKTFDDELDEILNGDDNSIEQIVADALGKSKSNSGANNKTKEEVKVDYESYAKENSIVFSLNNFKEILRIGGSLSPLNEIVNFISFKVSGDNIILYSSNSTEVIRNEFPIMNKTNRLPDGEFFSLPKDILVKAFRSSRGAITVFKENDKFRISVIGGSIPIENNYGLTEELYEKLLSIKPEISETINIAEYKDIISNLSGLAASAISPQQKTLVFSDKEVKVSFLRCFSRKRITNNLNLVMRVQDISILNTLINTNPSITELKIEKSSDNKLLYTVGNSKFSCIEITPHIRKEQEELLDNVIDQGVRFEVDINDVIIITSLLSSLKNTDGSVYLCEEDKKIKIKANLDKELNVFDINSIKVNNGELKEDLKLDTNMLNSLVSNYSGKVNIILHSDGFAVDSAEKSSVLGAEII